MLLYGSFQAIATALAIPIQFLDLALGMIYPFHEALILILFSKMLGGALTFYAANFLISHETKREYMNSPYIKGLSELIKLEPLKYGMLLRFSGIPIVLRNYGLAVLPISFLHYMICLLI